MLTFETIEEFLVMKTVCKSMTPDDAARAFFGQNEDAFEKMIDKLTASDPRLTKAFHNMRERYLDGSKA